MTYPIVEDDYFCVRNDAIECEWVFHKDDNELVEVKENGNMVFNLGDVCNVKFEVGILRKIKIQ